MASTELELQGMGATRHTCIIRGSLRSLEANKTGQRKVSCNLHSPCAVMLVLLVYAPSFWLVYYS